jgi:hypothetical protein
MPIPSNACSTAVKSTDTADGGDDPLDLSFAEEDTRYLILQADVATGEGDLPEQPLAKKGEFITHPRPRV